MKNAFSLLELIFVIVVIGILASIAIPKLMDTRNDALVSSIKQDLNSLTTSVQTYYMLNGKIDNISDAITLNSTLWEVDGLKAIFKDNENDCIIAQIIESDTKQFSIDINEDSSVICKKLVFSGIMDISYDLY